MQGFIAGYKNSVAYIVTNLEQIFIVRIKKINIKLTLCNIVKNEKKL